MNSALSILSKPVVQIGKMAVQLIMVLGEFVLLFIRCIRRMHLIFLNFDLTLKNMISIGVSSLPLVTATSIIAGMIAAVQADYMFRNFVPNKFLGTAVCKLVILELSPVLIGIIMAGRVGSALAAEIGSMKEKEELDAMKILALDPLRYLATPRLFAFMVMMPCLTIISMFLAICGGWVISIVALDVTSYTYTNGLSYFFNQIEVVASLVKSVVFGIIICLMGYYDGIHAGAGAKGVGEATMKVVVSSCVWILISNFFIDLLLLN